MSFNIPPPANITNLFRNWLNGVPKKKATLELVCGPYYELYGMFAMISSLTKKRFSSFMQDIPLAIH